MVMILIKQNDNLFYKIKNYNLNTYTYIDDYSIYRINILCIRINNTLKSTYDIMKVDDFQIYNFYNKVYYTEKFSCVYLRNFIGKYNSKIKKQFKEDLIKRLKLNYKEFNNSEFTKNDILFNDKIFENFGNGLTIFYVSFSINVDNNNFKIINL